MSEFWVLVDDEFGTAQGRALVRDHVLGTLGHRTPEQALAAGEDARTVWFALCEDLQVPEDRRWGRDEAAARPAPATRTPPATRTAPATRTSPTTRRRR